MEWEWLQIDKLGFTSSETCTDFNGFFQKKTSFVKNIFKKTVFSKSLIPDLKKSFFLSVHFPADLNPLMWSKLTFIAQGETTHLWEELERF